MEHDSPPVQGLDPTDPFFALDVVFGLAVGLGIAGLWYRFEFLHFA